MLVIGHRGSPTRYLENSFSSFEGAIKEGAHRIEFDVHLTKDDELVVMHDEDLKRTTGVDAQIAQLTRQEIKKIKLINGEDIPFLDELCDRFLDRIEFNIELKTPLALAAKKAAELILSYQERRRVIFSSFYWQPLLCLRDDFPDLERAFLIGAHFEWPQLAMLNPLFPMQELRCQIIHPWVGIINDNFMDQARLRQWTVYPYCRRHGDEDSNKTQLWSSMMHYNVAGLCTNYPAELVAWLNESDLNEEF